MPAMDPALDAALTEALLLARRGDAAATESYIQGVRSKFRPQDSFDAMARLMIAEAVAHLYAGRSSEARDRLKRSVALSSAISHSGNIALARAWLAYLDYDALQIQPFADHAFSVVRAGEVAPLHARARVASLLGTAYQLCESTAAAKQWFECARHSALDDQDQLMISTVIFNMSATRFSVARVRLVCESVVDAIDSRDLMFLCSSESYDAMVGFSVLGHFHSMLQGLAMSTKGDYEAALGFFHRYVGAALSTMDRRADAVVFAEAAWCHSLLAQKDEALISAQSAAERISSATDLDDLAVAHRRLADVFAACGDAAAAAFHAEASKTALAGFREHQRVTREMLDAYGVSPPAL